MKKLYLILINLIYWIIGTRVTEEQIHKDLKTVEDVYDEYVAVVQNYLITKFCTKRLRRLSINRLKAISMRTLELVADKKYSWNYITSDEYFIGNMRVLIESDLKEEINFYEGTIVLGTTVEESLVNCSGDSELDQLFSLCQYLIQKLKEKG